jgi:hypothetical protein
VVRSCRKIISAEKTSYLSTEFNDRLSEFFVPDVTRRFREAIEINGGKYGRKH